jgi:hypothetical protein
MKWTGGSPIYYYNGLNKDGTIYHTLNTNYNEIKQHISDETTIKTYTYGDDIGYILTDFTYPG